MFLNKPTNDQLTQDVIRTSYSNQMEKNSPCPPTATNFNEHVSSNSTSCTFDKALQDRTLQTSNHYNKKINEKNIRKRCEIKSKLTVKTSERHHCFLLLTLNKVNVRWVSLQNSTGDIRCQFLPSI